MTFPEHLEWLEEDILADMNSGKLELLRTGQDVLDLSMINPDLAPPRLLLDKLLESSVMQDKHRYAVSRGIKKLRGSFAYKYKETFGVNLNPEREICSTMGTKDALLNVLLCLKPKVRVLLGKPVYPAYLSALKYADLSYGFFEIVEDPDEMLSDIYNCLKTGSYKAIILNFPNNPTGATVDTSFYQKLAHFAERFNVFVINDFVYGEMCFNNRPAVSILSNDYFAANGAETYSLSKAYSVPGWRVGAVLGNEMLIKAVSRIKSKMDYGIFLPVQLAASAALFDDSDLVGEAREDYCERCELVSEGLKQLGWEIVPPLAGCSVWAKFPRERYKLNSLPFCRALLKKEKILLLPGICFGEDYDEYVRIALVAPIEKLIELLDRFSHFDFQIGQEHNEN